MMSHSSSPPSLPCTGLGLGHSPPSNFLFPHCVCSSCSVFPHQLWAPEGKMFFISLSTDTALMSGTVPSTKQVLKNVNWMKQYTWPGVDYLVWKIKVLYINLDKNNVLSTMLLHISLKTVFFVLFHGKVRPKSPLEDPMITPGAKKRLSPDQARRMLWAKDRLRTETEMRCWPYDHQLAVISFCKCEMTKISLKLTF